VQIDDNNDFIYLGRIDDQIKYLGYRIELGEIEASLVAIDQVDEGVVVFGKRKSDDESEIGALVSCKQPLDVIELRKILSERLPGYMVPTNIKIFDGEFPRTTNGKYDRKRVTSLVFD
jgi:acyl-coenzyme A synthetase/AMP-(fatty) acid ligase